MKKTNKKDVKKIKGFRGYAMKTIKISALIFALLTTLVLVIFAYINLPVSLPDEKPDLGVTFSMRYAQDIGLDWKQAYIAMLDELGVKRVRVPAYWDSIEKEDGVYDFSDLDWQIQEASKRNAEVILAVGQKVPRWPECYVPKWIGENDAKRKEKLPVFVEKTIERYKNDKTIAAWQIENEPFLKFGICPDFDVDLLDREIEIAKRTDPDTPIMLTDSGELSFWIPAAKRGDRFGTTMYREVITKEYGAWKYPIGPNFFKIKRLLVRMFANQKNVAVIELQGEPWIEGWTTNFPLDRQYKSMDAQKLKENIEFARKTGIKEIYVWGVEWWYWLKVNHGENDVWNQAIELYK